jgi:uncharacterized membrane protein
MRAGILHMLGFSALDFIALALFVGAWIGYAIALEWSPFGRGGLNARMNGYRDLWMERMLEREVRIVDTQIMASLQNGTAFFASTTLLAIGGSLTLLRSTDDILNVVSNLPLAIQATRVQWEAKAMGLTIIFVYAFFKFAWSYRLFNYVAIMLGATPPYEERNSVEARTHARRTARLCAAAGRHFNRGQRAFFFALGYLGWFVGPSLLIVTTLAIVLVMWRRQFYSESLRALTEV